MSAVTIISGGLHTTIQDAGRGGYQKFAMPLAGAFDNYAFRVANMLVGNEAGAALLRAGGRGAAALEFTFVGPTMKFASEAMVAVTGGRFDVKLDGSSCPQWEAVAVPAGGLLEIGAAITGARGYLSIAGGFDVPEYMGSRSTLVGARAGGYAGRSLRAGDVVDAGLSTGPVTDGTTRRWNPSPSRLRPPPTSLRVVLGPQDMLFTEESVDLFLSSPWTLASQSDRTASRFAGVRLAFREGATDLNHDPARDPSNIVDDVIPIGGIQVTAGSELLVAGVDGLTIGGYAKIATVITADIQHLAQVRPGQTVTFQRISTQEAIAAGRQDQDAVDERYLL